MVLQDALRSGMLPSALCSAVRSLEGSQDFLSPLPPWVLLSPITTLAEQDHVQGTGSPEAGTELWKGLGEASRQLSPRPKR